MTARSLRNGLFLAVLIGVLAAVVRSLRGPATGAFASPEGPIELRPAPPSAPVAAVPTTPVTDLVLASDRAVEPLPDGPVAPVEPAVGEVRPKAWGGRRVWEHPVDGGCPDGFPVKAKLSSGIFHMPGGLSYDRTTPDRCYPDAAAAEADGLRRSKR